MNYLRSRSGYAKLKSCLCKKSKRTLSEDFLSKISKHLSTFDFFTSVWHDTTFHHILLLGQLTIKGHCQTVTNIYHRIKCVFGKILGTAILFCHGCIRFFKDFMSVVLPSYHPSNDSISESFFHLSGSKKWFHSKTTSRIQVKKFRAHLHKWFLHAPGSTRKKNLKVTSWKIRLWRQQQRKLVVLRIWVVSKVTLLGFYRLNFIAWIIR